MYSTILETPYSKAREKFTRFDGVDSVRHILTVKSAYVSRDAISEDSDIIIYYSMVNDTTPLVVIERMRKEEAKRLMIKKVVKSLKKEIKGYMVNISTEHNDYVDVVLVKNNIYECL